MTFAGPEIFGIGIPLESTPFVDTEYNETKLADEIVLKSAFATTYPVPLLSSTRFAGTGVAAWLPSLLCKTPDSVTVNALVGAQLDPAAGLFSTANPDPS